MGSLRSNLLLKISLSFTIGFGILSCILFLHLQLNSSFNNLFFFQILVLFFFVGFYFILANKNAISIIEKKHYQLKVKSLLLICFLAIFFLFSAVLIRFIFSNPHGDWDAWAQWNMHARFLYFSKEYWATVFSDLPGWTHPTYPLLLPGTVATSWIFMKTNSVLGPMLISATFTFSILGVLLASLSIIKNLTQGIIAGVLLLSTSFFLASGTTQYADIPLAFFFLATFVFIILNERAAGNNDLLALAGFTAGLAAWTKNEGMIFLIMATLAYSIIIIKLKGVKTYFKNISLFILGLLPVILILIYFKFQVSSPDPYLSSNFQPLLSKFLNFSRHIETVNAFFAHSSFFGNWPFDIRIFLFLYLLVFGIRINKNDLAAVLILALSILFMLISYYFIYILTPYSLTWQINTSLNRLLLQLWPSFILLFFMVISTPEEAIERSKKKKVVRD